MGVGLFYGAFIFVTTLTSLRAMGVGLFYGAFIFVTTLTSLRAMGVGLFYGAFIFVGGLLALLLSTIAVAAASSLGGAYAVFWGKFLHISILL